MKYSNYICLFFISILFLGCELENIDVDKFGKVSGIIVDGENYEPLSGVQVSTTPPSTSVLTDEDGNFHVDKVPYGEVVINTRKKGYLSGSISIAVYDQQNTDLTFFLLEDERDVGNVVIYDPVPGNGAADQPSPLTFEWKVDQDNRSRQLVYTVYLFESNTTVQSLVGENLTSTQVVVPNLKGNTTYFWYVVAKYEGRNVANSPTWTFSTD